MIAYRFLQAGLSLLILAPAAWAQTPLIANRPPLPDLARDLLNGSLTRGAAVADTVASWRYLPLEVGNAWEYESSFYYAAEWAALRIDIPKDTLIGEQHYVVWDERRYNDDGEVNQAYSYRVPIRYDTLSAQVVELLYDESGERPFLWAPCPFDADFDSVAICNGDAFEVSGTYEGVLDFEPDTTVTDVAVKTFVLDPVYMDRFAGGFGKALYYEYESEGYHALRYARVGGEEFGMEQLPVASEGGASQAESFMLSAYPNPFRERLTAAFELSQAGPVVLEVVDVLGRVVWWRDLGVLASGRHETHLGGEALGTGVYLIRVTLEGETLFTRRVTRIY